MQTRQYPRTLNQAFGPYTSTKITEPDRPFDWQDKLVMAASIACAVAVAFILWGRV